MLGGQADLESPYPHVVKVPVYFIERFLVLVRMLFQGFPLAHGHKQQGVQTGWEHLAHQGLVLQMDSHSLVEVANMLHEIHPSIIHGKRWLGEPSRKYFCFSPMDERRLGDLAQNPAHGIVAQAFVRWGLPTPSVMVLLVIRKRLTEKSLWPRLVAIIAIFARRMDRTQRSSSALLTSQFSS